jgi:hypothetical protein
MRRMLMAGIAIAFPLVGAFAYAGTAAAATGVTCTKLTGTISGSGSVKVTISGCNDKANTGGGGTETSSETATTGKITWKGGKGTTSFKDINSTPVSSGTCPSTDIEEETVTTVSTGTGAAKASIKKGWTSESYVCYNPNATKNQLSLAPGTKYLIGPGL